MDEDSAVIYALGEDREVVGPFSLGQLRRGLAARKLDLSTLVSTQGDQGWVPVSEFLERVAPPPSTPTPVSNDEDDATRVVVGWLVLMPHSDRAVQENTPALLEALARGAYPRGTLVRKHGESEWLAIEKLQPASAPTTDKIDSGRLVSVSDRGLESQPQSATIGENRQPIESGASSVVPRAPAKAQGSRPARLIPLLVLLFLLVSLGAGGGAFLFTRETLAQRVQAGRAAAAQESSLNGEFRFSQLEDGRFPYPRGPLDEEAAKGRWHWLITVKQGRVTKAIRVTPSGQVKDSSLVEWRGGEERRVTTLDGYNTVQYSTEISADGLARRVSRANVPFWDNCAALRRTYDDDGHVAREDCLDRQGNKVLRSDGCFGRKLVWHMTGAVSEQACLSDDGEGVADGDGIHRRTFVLNDMGDVVEENFLDGRGGRVARASDGCARVRTKRDEAGNAVEETCLDDAGSPKLRSGERHSITLMKRDKNGCLSEVSYADADRRPTDDPRLVLTSDAHCTPVRRESFGADGKRVGVIFEDKLSDSGDCIERRCSVGSGPAQCPNVGFYSPGDRGSLVKWDINEKGQTVSKKCFRSDGTPSGCDEAYPHEQRFTFDPEGQPTSESYFDSKGEPAKWNGVHRQELIRNALGRLTSKKYLNVEGEPVHGACGNAGFQITYDNKMRMVAIREVDKAGKLKAPHCRSSLDGITWPMSAAQMEIRRGEGGALTNEYTNSNGVKLKTVDCAKPGTECYR